jgi:hypothetical protein
MSTTYPLPPVLGRPERRGRGNWACAPVSISPSAASTSVSEQDSDRVKLLHRRDAFERDDTLAGEADLIIAKHLADRRRRLQPRGGSLRSAENFS